MRKINPILRGLIFCCFANSPSFTCAQSFPENNVPELSVLHFSKNSSSLSRKNKILLDSALNISAKYPKYFLAIGCNCPTENIKYNTIMWDRQLSVANYLIRKGIDTGKVIISSFPVEKYEVIYLKLEAIESFKEPQPHPYFKKQEGFQ